MKTPLTAPMTLSELLAGLTADGEEHADIVITDLVLDSRDVTEGSLFIALKGVQKHGLEFAVSAIDKGAAAIVWENDDAWGAAEYSVPVIAVDALREKLGVMANRFFGDPSASVTVVGVTGTDGKSTVSHFVADALNACGNKAAVIGTLGVGIPGELQATGLTTPDVMSVHRLLAQFKQQGIQYAVMEVSSHALDQQRVAGVRFAVALLTNLGRDHLDYHETMEAYAAAKATLFYKEGLQAVVLNQDDGFGKQLIGECAKDHSAARLITYSTQNTTQQKKNTAQMTDQNHTAATCKPSAECLLATTPQYLDSGIRTTIRYQKAGAEVVTETVSAPVLGEFNVYNLLAATGCLMGLGLSFKTATEAVQQVKGVPGRMEKVSAADEALVVVDYAHTPGALEAALKAVRHHVRYRVVCVFGCGGDRDKGKRPMMAKVAEQYADMVVLTDDNPRSEMPFQIMHDMIRGLERPEHVAVEHNRAKAIRFAVNAAQPGDAVLIAGKGHETVQIVGSEKYPFDDRLEAMAALRERIS